MYAREYTVGKEDLSISTCEWQSITKISKSAPGMQREDVRRDEWHFGRVNVAERVKEKTKLFKTLTCL